ncbi:MAG: cyclodeaminase/cyclohydrolase family protein [Caulobacteraceae bacterium]
MPEKSCNEFIQELSSKSPVPGGGGAAAYVGALGMALGNMVGNLTLGKKKYKVETMLIGG